MKRLYSTLLAIISLFIAGSFPTVPAQADSSGGRLLAMMGGESGMMGGGGGTMGRGGSGQFDQFLGPIRNPYPEKN